MAKLNRQGVPDLNGKQVNERKIHVCKFVKSTKYIVDPNVGQMYIEVQVLACDYCGKEQ